MMKRIGSLFSVLMCTLALVATDVDAARLGGGKSFGRQSPNVTQRQATPPQAAPAQPGAPVQQAQPSVGRQAPAAAAAQSGRSRWLALLAGIAAGLGLAALASHLGFGEGLATLMLVALLVVAAFVVVRMIMARRAQPRPAFQSGYGSTGIGSEASVRYAPLDQVAGKPGTAGAPADALVGAGAADASASAATRVATPASGGAPAAWQVPTDFDVDGFTRNAKVMFIRLQAAFDAGDLNDLREFTTPEMFAELKMQVAERPQAGNRTDVVRLDAELLGIESDVDHLASVRFSGLIRESEGATAQPFDEVWNLEKPVSGAGGWLLAGIQQLN